MELQDRTSLQIVQLIGNVILDQCLIGNQLRTATLSGEMWWNELARSYLSKAKKIARIFCFFLVDTALAIAFHITWAFKSSLNEASSPSLGALNRRFQQISQSPEISENAEASQRVERFQLCQTIRVSPCAALPVRGPVVIHFQQDFRAR